MERGIRNVVVFSIRHLASFCFGLLGGALALIFAVLVIGWQAEKSARQTGFTGLVAVDPFSIIARPPGTFYALLLFAVGFYVFSRLIGRGRLARHSQT